MMDKNMALAAIDALAPVMADEDATFETHMQAMACTSCFLAGETPPEHFPQRPGLWEHPCPKCGENAVWVTPPRPR